VVHSRGASRKGMRRRLKPLQRKERRGLELEAGGGRFVPLPKQVVRNAFRVWTSQPKGEELAETPVLRRKEVRFPAKMFVNLCSEENSWAEIARTFDISSHGARVVSKRSWRPNQELSVRSIRGHLYSRARVVYCQPATEDSFVVGIEMYYPTGDWTTREMKRTTPL